MFIVVFLEMSRRFSSYVDYPIPLPQSWKQGEYLFAFTGKRVPDPAIPALERFVKAREFKSPFWFSRSMVTKHKVKLKFGEVGVCAPGDIHAVSLQLHHLGEYEAIDACAFLRENTPPKGCDDGRPFYWDGTRWRVLVGNGPRQLLSYPTNTQDAFPNWWITKECAELSELRRKTRNPPVEIARGNTITLFNSEQTFLSLERCIPPLLDNLPTLYRDSFFTFLLFFFCAQ